MNTNDEIIRIIITVIRKRIIIIIILIIILIIITIKIIKKSKKTQCGYPYFRVVIWAWGHKSIDNQKTVKDPFLLRSFQCPLLKVMYSGAVCLCRCLNWEERSWKESRHQRQLMTGITVNHHNCHKKENVDKQTSKIRREKRGIKIPKPDKPTNNRSNVSYPWTLW